MNIYFSQLNIGDAFHRSDSRKTWIKITPQNDGYGIVNARSLENNPEYVYIAYNMIVEKA